MLRRLWQLPGAVLYTLAIAGFGQCAAAQDPDLRSKINDALDMARPALLAHLTAANKAATRPGELALLMLAALHDGVPAADPVMQKSIKKLGKAKIRQTYDLALRLLVLEACPTFPDRDKHVTRDTKALLAHRCDEGAFQYHHRPSAWDLSNTQYGALGLRAAAAMGQKIRKDVWSKLARLVGDQQDGYGGFGYTRNISGWKSYASMTAAGIAVLAICRQQLGDRYARKRVVDDQIEDGWDWFARNQATIGSPKERWSYYFHYGLERAAILTDVEKIDGKVDWYETGARMLVEEQLSGGGWRSTSDGFPGHHLSSKRGDAVPTAFAVLFLRRKFQKVSGPITQHIVRMVNIGPKSKQKDVDACADGLIKLGKPAMMDVVKGLRSDIEPQRRAAAKALVGIAGEAFGYDPKVDREANKAAVRKAELWYLRNR